MAIFVGLVGLIFGSFLTALTWRTPREISIAKGRSVCPKCNSIISWYDNIPLLSYLLLGGKCRKCKNKISLRYPLIEFTTMFLFVGTYVFMTKLNLPHSPFSVWQEYLRSFSYLFVLFIALVGIAISVVDLEHKIIPDEYVYWTLGLTMVIYIIFISQGFYMRLIMGLLPALVLLLINLITRGRGMGLGDVKLAILLGFLLGWPYTLVWFFGAFLTGAIVGITLILVGKAKFGKEIPFGPFLVFSFYITFFFGDVFIKWLLK